MEFAILYAIQNLRSEYLDKIMIIITSLGNLGIFWICVGLLLLIGKKTRKTGITVIIALILCFLVGNIILKNTVKRDRPSWIDNSIDILIDNPKDYSFPSGHTEASFAAAMAIYLNRKKEGILALILAGAIAFSRLYMFVHFPSDVVGGMIIGCIIGIMANIIVNKVYMKNELNLE